MSVTLVDGFVAAGIHCGVKASGDPDLALVATADGEPVAAAGVFTRNRMIAAPVVVSRRHLASSNGQAAAIVLNSGCANAATGEQGLADAAQMCAVTGGVIGCSPDEVLVCSTGLIGYSLPMKAIESGIPAVAAGLSSDGGGAAADAIRTTDTVVKEAAATGTATAGAIFTVGAMAKGAAMLEPNMATMLAVLTTDAEAEPVQLTAALQAAVAASFNRLTVDGAESTNDTVLVLAAGGAGPAGVDALTSAFTTVCRDLALQMADDAEGSTKTVVIAVVGATDDSEAAKVARDLANNQLIKCSWYGKDPYWGRLAAEAGASAPSFEESTLSISYGDHLVYAAGAEAAVDRDALTAYMQGRRLDLTIDLGQGPGSAEIITTDLSHAYIDENMGTS